MYIFLLRILIIYAKHILNIYKQIGLKLYSHFIVVILGETRLTDDVSQYPTISQSELETVLNYILSWPQRYVFKNIIS